MVNPEVTTPTEAAANSNSPTPAEIAQAQAILAQAGASQDTLLEARHDTLPESSDTEPTDQELDVEVIVIDILRKQKVETQFTTSINDPRFWSNLKRLDRLEDALKVPMFDDRSMQQFAISAKDELKSLALDLALKNMTVPVMPTEAEITVLAKSKYNAKLQKDAAKAAKGYKAKPT